MSDRTDSSRTARAEGDAGHQGPALDQMVADTESMGLYDEDSDAVREALRLARASRNQALPSTRGAH
jgi:hypothetical protein